MSDDDVYEYQSEDDGGGDGGDDCEGALWFLVWRVVCPSGPACPSTVVGFGRGVAGVLQG
jgi:hypothetical protein